MPIGPRTRWIFYAAAGAATLAAMKWVDEPQDEGAAVVAAVTRAPVPGAATKQPEADGQVKLDWLKRKPGEELPRADPFSARPLAPTQEAQAPAPPPPPPPPPQAPPLPFTYLGKWTEQGKTTIFLARGDQHVAVKGPGRLDDSYAVESVDDRQVVLTYVPLGIRQVLPLVPGAPPVQAAGAAAPAAQQDPNEETN